MHIVSQEGLVELLAPASERRLLLGDEPRAVRRVVRDAHERIKGAHGAALRSRQHAKGVVKIPRFPACQAFAISVRAGQHESPDLYAGGRLLVVLGH